MVNCHTSTTLTLRHQQICSAYRRYRRAKPLHIPFPGGKARFRRLPSGFALAAMLMNSAVAAEATHGMVVSSQREASAAGLEILKNGGYAVDAAVAVGYALAVADPCCGNIGGGGFMLIHRAAGGDAFINFRERAPLHATANMYLDAQGNVVPDRSTKTWLAIGVPGTVAGLERARS